MRVTMQQCLDFTYLYPIFIYTEYLIIINTAFVQSRLSRKVVYNFTIFAIINEIVINKNMNKACVQRDSFTHVAKCEAKFLFLFYFLNFIF